MNPAVTVALWLMDGFPGRSVPPYVLAQLAGSAAGTGLGRLVWGHAVSVPPVDYVAIRPAPAWQPASVFLAEMGCDDGPDRRRRVLPGSSPPCTPAAVRHRTVRRAGDRPPRSPQRGLDQPRPPVRSCRTLRADHRSMDLSGRAGPGSGPRGRRPRPTRPRFYATATIQRRSTTMRIQLISAQHFWRRGRLRWGSRRSAGRRRATPDDLRRRPSRERRAAGRQVHDVANRCPPSARIPSGNHVLPARRALSEHAHLLRGCIRRHRQSPRAAARRRRSHRWRHDEVGRQGRQADGHGRAADRVRRLRPRRPSSAPFARSRPTCFCTS